MTFKTVIGEYFKNARLKLGYSLREAADKAGISHNHVREIEVKEINPTFDTIVGLLKAYNLTIEDFSQKTGFSNICETKRMPAKFLERLSGDIQKLEEQERKDFYDSLSYPAEFLKRVLKGDGALSEKEITKIAILLKQPIFEYLEISEYLPEELKALKHEGTLDMLRAMNSLSTDEIVTVVNSVANMLKIAVRKKQGKDG